MHLFLVPRVLQVSVSSSALCFGIALWLYVRYFGCSLQLGVLLAIHPTTRCHHAGSVRFLQMLWV